MFIALNGQLGSGKSEVCKIFKEKGYEIYNGGRALRESAAELGISILELNELAKKDYSYDMAIDRKTIDYAEANKGKDVVFDSRMAWFFVKGAYKVHLLVSPMIAAERVFNNRESKEERYTSKECALKDLLERRKVENERYNMIYSATMLDYSNYDLIIDTSNITPLEVYEKIKEGLADFEKGNKEQKVWLSPKNIYPSKKVEELSVSRMKFYYDKIKRGEKLKPVELIDVDDFLFVMSGHNRVSAYNNLKENLIEGKIKYSENKKIKEIKEGKITKEDLKKWEEYNKIQYSYYPEFFK